MIQAPEPAQPRGALCKQGRFGLLRNGHLRVVSPLIRDRHGRQLESTLDEALEAAAEKLKAAWRGCTAGVVSSRLPGQTLSLFDNFVRDVLGSDCVDTCDGRAFRVIAQGIKQFHGKRKGLDIECGAEEILQADCILLVGADPLKTHPVIGALIRRAVDERKARLVVVNVERDVFPLWSTLWLAPRAGSEGAVLSGLSKSIIDNGLLKIVCPQSDPARGEHPEAEQRLRSALAVLRSEGLDVHGQIAHPDPFVAAMEAVEDERTDEIIVSTFPDERSGWLRRDLVGRLRSETGLPVDHVVVETTAEVGA